MCQAPSTGAQGRLAKGVRPAAHPLRGAAYYSSREGAKPGCAVRFAFGRLRFAFAKQAGAGAKQAMKNKADECHALGIIPEEQCFQALSFESEGHMCKEAGQLLHAWSMLWMERHEKTKGDADRLLHRWRMELALLRAKFLAKCISERAHSCRQRPRTTRTRCGLTFASPRLADRPVRRALSAARGLD